MKESSALRKISNLALQRRRQGLVKLLPPAEEILRGSLVERYVTCGNPNCKCARGERHGPVWYLTVTLGPVAPRERSSAARNSITYGAGLQTTKHVGD